MVVILESTYVSTNYLFSPSLILFLWLLVFTIINPISMTAIHTSMCSSTIRFFCIDERTLSKKSRMLPEPIHLWFKPHPLRHHCNARCQVQLAAAVVPKPLRQNCINPAILCLICLQLSIEPPSLRILQIGKLAKLCKVKLMHQIVPINKQSWLQFMLQSWNSV